jgi:hypothetical protein
MSDGEEPQAKRSKDEAEVEEKPLPKGWEKVRFVVLSVFCHS